MTFHPTRRALYAAALTALACVSGPTAQAATTVQVGASGKTFASSAVQCGVHPSTGARAPWVQVGLFNPLPKTEAKLRLNGVKQQELQAEAPTADLWLPVGTHTIELSLSKRLGDTYVFSVASGQCDLVPTPGNFYSPDGSLEYAASGKSYLGVVPGCALNPATGLAQPFVNLFDNGSFLLNVSVNGSPLTQLSALRPRVAVFLAAGPNVVTAANGSLSTDRFVRDGGTGSCTLP